MDRSLGLQIAQNRSYLFTLGSKVGIFVLDLETERMIIYADLASPLGFTLVPYSRVFRGSRLGIVMMVSGRCLIVRYLDP